MCGIAGYIGSESLDQHTIKATLGLMKNRGPDHQDSRAFQDDEHNVYLLHSRLSIIDLDPRSHQPFSLHDCHLIFNGEIYNYVELRDQLTGHGEHCHTSSDTEVLLRYYLRYGEFCVDHFEGMWSLAIFDNRSKTLFLSRDRFAEKPLYYLPTCDGLFFGSEIKFIKCLSDLALSVNDQQVLRYLVNGYKSLYKTGDTFYTEIKELDFATNLTVDCRLQTTTRRYWKPSYRPSAMTLEQAVEGVRERLRRSVSVRLRADVPLAFCLSGGLDSTGLASIAKKDFGYEVATYSIIDQDERYNEEKNIRKTIDDLQCRHRLIHVNSKGNLERLQKLVAYHDAPLITITYLVHSFLSEAIAQDGYKVAVSGTGADEMFAGYYDHFNLHLYEMRHHQDYDTYLKDWQTQILPLVRNPFLKNPELYFDHPGQRQHIYLNNDQFTQYLTRGFQEAFQEHHYADSLLRNRMLNEMFHEGTRPILHDDDLNAMMYSIENRSPYLDRDLFEFVYTIPNDYLIRNGYGKFILREALKGTLNDDVRLYRRKMGFNASIQSIVDFSDPSTMDYLLAESPIFDILQRNKMAELFTWETIPNSYSKFIFNFINVKIFLEQTERVNNCETPALKN